MKNFTKVISLLLVLAMFAAAAVACVDTNKPNDTQTGENTGSSTDTNVTPDEYTGYVSKLDADGKYARAEDETIYAGALAEFEKLRDEASKETDPSKRFVLYAKAEAELLDSSVMVPTTTQGGAYTISRIAPHTVPYVQWGNDDDRLKGLVISDSFLTKEERSELLDQWSKAMLGEGAYDPAAYLTGKGHTLQNTYATTFTTPCATFDWLNTSMQSDTEITVNTVDGLVEYNNLNQMTPALAESWDVSSDGLTYTFHIRTGAAWYTSEGTKYADVTANDFVAGFHHMLDGEGELQWLVDGVVAGVHAYLTEGGSFDNVGYKATDDHTLVITLEGPTSYFLTMLTYSCFLPLCDSFYQAHGGVYGLEEYKAAVADTAKYTYGSTGDIANQVYCGPYLITKFDGASEIVLTKNANYYKADQVTLDQIRWVHDDGSDIPALYADVVKGTYAGMGLSEGNGSLKLAKDDGYFDANAYVSDTTSTTYFSALNLNRGTFALENGAATSAKTEQQKADTVTALNNKNFRQALNFAFDQATWNAVSRGEDLKATNLRNMYCHPEFVSLAEDVTDAEGKTFAKGTFYGEIVQYYLDKLGSTIKVADSANGWYNEAEAKKHLEAAVAELGDKVSYPIVLDVVYYSPSDTQTGQATAFKKGIEGVLGDKVQVNLVETTVDTDYYACGYRAAHGINGNYDVFYGSGWGPDYGDPSTYLDTFANYNGYMLKTIGLY